MKADYPLVSVIIPAYNAEIFLSRTLKSVLSQTYKNIEVLVVDDGSLDRTAEIVETFAQKDSRVILLKQQNAGVAAARNLAIEKSRGEYIAPIDADDIWYPEKIEKQVQCMLQADQSVGLVYAWSAFIDEEDVIIGEYTSFYYLNIPSIEGYVYPAMMYTNLIGNASVPLIRRACFDKIGFYNSNLKQQNAQGCEDWDIYLRIAEYYQFRVVPEFLIGYRQVRGSMSKSYKSMAKSYDLVMADSKKRHPEIPTCIYNWSASSFYVYVLTISREYGDYWSTLVWLYKAIKLDNSPLLQTWVYRCFFICLMQIVVKHLTSLILPKHHSSLHQEKFNYPKNIAVTQVTTLADIQKEMHKPQEIPRKPHAKIRWRRWLYIVQLCRELSYIEKTKVSLTVC
ncbi:family 2 glycosyl transferase [Tolypothrix sp. NIES-4075]|uniref:glycosyltransferase family 2 protein n=1 Tax=Tolypothrix sp. NIES-4075 TaxID=2005459 RepID=UPI000B5C8825|nr:glycosyltransferase family 2 protein [Tolypothrix sp. NIES-4075]GAX42585.1 family 2 glycosyl transferase [Tolypothrix sp. NIES-4075]